MPNLPTIVIEDLLSVAGAIRVGVAPFAIREEFYRVNEEQDRITHGALFLGAVARGMAMQRGKVAGVAMDEAGVTAIRQAAQLIEGMMKAESMARWNARERARRIVA